MSPPGQCQKPGGEGIRTPEALGANGNDGAGCKSGDSLPSSLASLNFGKLGQELSAIVAAWPTLRPELQAAILAIIISAGKGDAP